ncbi:hypothetical protein QM012_006006 [Aureobasidium pullulans]|uniref:Uncharacterized protein n=1 Tax=Aureobasidium pullulans TaxID=5580 RepID=A0ABR0TRC9_AURPU
MSASTITTLTPRLLARSLAAAFTRLFAYIFARYLASFSSFPSHFQINTHGFNLALLATLDVAAVPNGELPLKEFDPDVPGEDDAKGCQKQGESD